MVKPLRLSYSTLRHCIVQHPCRGWPLDAPMPKPAKPKVISLLLEGMFCGASSDCMAFTAWECCCGRLAPRGALRGALHGC